MKLLEGAKRGGIETKGWQTPVVAVVLAAGLAVALVAGLVAGCSSSYPGETAYPLPSGPIVIDLPVQSPLASDTGCVPLALPPVRVEWDASRRDISFGGQKVLWPNGYSARLLPTGRLEIVGPDGTVVARDGDTIQFGGSDYQHVCSIE